MSEKKLVYITGGLLAAKSIQLLLQSFQIQSEAIQESAGVAYGFTAGGLGQAKIYVDEENEGEALRILRMMENGELEMPEFDSDYVDEDPQENDLLE